MLGIVITLAAAVFVGKRARQAHVERRRYSLLASGTIAVAVALIGGSIDGLSGIWSAVGVASERISSSMFILYVLGYGAVSLYLMFATFFGRVLPITFGTR